WSFRSHPELRVPGDRDRRVVRDEAVAKVLRQRRAVAFRAQLATPGVGCSLVELEGLLVREDDAVGVAGELDRGEVVEHVLPDLRGIALQRVAVAGRVRLAELDE